jgi:hypothetical protein
MRSCFEEFIAMNLMEQSEFNLGFMVCEKQYFLAS